MHLGGEFSQRTFQINSLILFPRIAAAAEIEAASDGPIYAREGAIKVDIAPQLSATQNKDDDPDLRLRLMMRRVPLWAPIKTLNNGLRLAGFFLSLSNNSSCERDTQKLAKISSSVEASY